MARVLGVLDGLCQPGAAGQGSLTAQAATAIRQEVEAAYRDHLARRGKKRWCDKSLDNVHCADLLANLWPQAQFVCLTRHCMDVIASVLEVCPWGLSGFGLDRYTAQYPGNNVAPAGASWLGTARAMLAFESKYPGRCHRVRYEDLVTQPEQVAAGIFSFLGVRQVPGVTRECFRDEHQATGPGDAKIWFTSAVHADSVGRGVTVPVAMLPPAMRASISQTLERLGYQPVTSDWNHARVPRDPRATAAGPSRAEMRAGPAELHQAATLIAARTAGIDEDRPAQIVSHWPFLAGATLLISAYSGARHRNVFRCQFPGASGMPPAAGTPEEAAAGPAVTFTADAPTWLALLDGTANPATEIMAGRLRCTSPFRTGWVPSGEAHALAELLRLPAIPAAHSGQPAQHQRSPPGLAEQRARRRKRRKGRRNILMKLSYRSLLRPAIRALTRRRSRPADPGTTMPPVAQPPPAGKPQEIIKYEISPAAIPQVHSNSVPTLAAADSGE